MQRTRRSTRRLATAAIETLETRRLLSGAVVGLTPDNTLVTFDSARPGKITATRSISGLLAGEEVVGIDYRPADGKLYGLVDAPGAGADRIVQISKSGVATNVFNLTTPLSGDEFGVDFNPVADALRIVSDLDQNLRVPFATGATVVDGSLAYGVNDFNAGANPNVVGAAYTNSFPGATATVLYDIDSGLDALAIQNPPNAGTLMTVGPLGVDTTALVGFDIRASNSSKSYRGEAIVALKRAADAFSRLYSINLATGGVRDIGPVGNAKKGTPTLRDITLSPDTGKRSNNDRNDDRDRWCDRDDRGERNWCDQRDSSDHRYQC